MSRIRAGDSAREARDAAIASVRAHPVLAPMAHNVHFLLDHTHDHVGLKGWATVTPTGNLWLHPKRRADTSEWARIIADLLVCLGFGLVTARAPQSLWELCSLLVADRFCHELKIGQLPEDLLYRAPPIPNGGAETLFRQYCTEHCEPQLLSWYDALSGASPLFHALGEKHGADYRRPDWQSFLADGIASGVGQAIEVAAHGVASTVQNARQTGAQRAKRRLIDSYPLLGALAASFDIDEDLRVCRQYEIQIAAIDVGIRRIWINPAAGLSKEEYVFVFAHELLHAGLNHASRCRGRDPWLWNVACDFVINGWLIEMGVGCAPACGLLYDAKFGNRSAEEIYDELATDIRRARKLATLRGTGQPDMFGADAGRGFTDAEAYCRRALAQGLERCLQSSMRGTLPAGLIESIRSLDQPPIPWDARLAEWFDERFPALEARRSYARPSRRQSVTPDFPRPALIKPEEERARRVFGVVLDTSGSMEPLLLGKALGAIASYAMARDVSAVRLIFCDAQPYDGNWVEPERLLDRFAVRGRGGTILQPAIDLLQMLANRREFPADGPVLVITDGFCEEHLDVRMDHAFLLPQGHHLPFRPRGEVFCVS